MRPLDAIAIARSFDGIQAAVASYDEDTLADLLQEAVPEFSPSESVSSDSPAVIVPFPGRRGRGRRS